MKQDKYWYVWPLMLVIAALLSCAAQGQGFDKVPNDSIELKVQWSKKIGNKSYYIFKLPSGEKVRSVCTCKELRRKGTVVKVAKNDLIFE